MAAPEPSPSGFGSALDSIVKELHDHPPLLYGLGGGILVIGLAGAVGGAAGNQLWLLVLALVVLVLAGLAAWVVVSRKPEAPPPPARAEARAGRDIVAEGGRVLSVEGSGENWAPVFEAGRDIRASDGGEIGTRRSREEPESSQGGPAS